MQRHDRGHIRYHRDRVIEKWKRYRRQEFEAREPRTGLDPSIYSWWLQEGRFAKLTLSCDRHAICKSFREETKFRTHKQAYYRRLDQIEEAAYS